MPKGQSLPGDARVSHVVRGLIEDARLVRLGYADAARLLPAWEAFWQSAGDTVPDALVAGLCVEAWLRRYESATQSI